MHKYQKYLTILFSTVAVLSFFGYKVKKRRLYAREIRRCHQQVVERLKSQRLAAIRDTTGFIKPYLESVVLRDDILKGESNKTKKWEAVSHSVEADHSVRLEIMEIYGEIKRVWEWVGN